MTDAQLLIDEVADRLRVSKTTVRRLIGDGKIGTVRPSPGRITIPESEVARYQFEQYEKLEEVESWPFTNAVVSGTYASKRSLSDKLNNLVGAPEKPMRSRSKQK